MLKTTYAVTNPIIYNLLPEALTKIEDSKWKTRHILFFDMQQASQLRLQGNMLIPRYAVVLSIEHEESVVPEPIKFDLGVKPPEELFKATDRGAGKIIEGRFGDAKNPS